MEQLSDHFSLQEMLLSPTAIAEGYEEQNHPSESVISNLNALCDNILEPLRIKIDAPITVTSGYRCPRVNTKIGGATNSQHLYGQAADINAKGYTVEQLYQFIKKSDLHYDQLIQEFGAWAHVSYGPLDRRQNLRATKVNGHTVYTEDREA